MEVASTKVAFRAVLDSARGAGRTVGLVPIDGTEVARAGGLPDVRRPFAR